jgi:hypothetical protein
MSNTSLENNLSECANCGKGEEASIDLKACAACKLVKYCSRDCQIAHRPQHKKECKKRAKELLDEKLFKQPPPEEDCPICMIQLPSLGSGRTYMVCCGKMICTGCINAVESRSKGHPLCPYCRTPVPTTDEEVTKRYEKRSELNDAQAISSLGRFYAKGEYGVPQNSAKALELWHRAGELGFTRAYHNIACCYKDGVNGLERDKKKVTLYLELAAMGGHALSRFFLGGLEVEAGNLDRALKHFMIATKGGDSDSLEYIKLLYKRGHAAKDDYANALRSYQAYLDEIKSDQRDEAAAAREEYKYYE